MPPCSLLARFGFAWLVVGSVVAASGVSGNGTVRDDLADALEMWAPSSVDVHDGVAVVHTAERQVSMDVYYTMVFAGVCLRESTHPGYLTGLREVHIVNSFGRQGFILEDPHDACAEYAAASPAPTSNEAKAIILGRTRQK